MPESTQAHVCLPLLVETPDIDENPICFGQIFKASLLV